MNFHERFKLLAIFHYIFAGIAALCGFFPLMYVGLGAWMVTGAFPPGPNAPPPEMGWFFIGFGALFSVVVWAMAAAMGAAGYFLHVQRHYNFCLVVAALECLQMPLGTILGVFTIVSLMDQQGKAMFDRPHVAEGAEP